MLERPRTYQLGDRSMRIACRDPLGVFGIVRSSNMKARILFLFAALTSAALFSTLDHITPLPPALTQCMTTQVTLKTQPVIHDIVVYADSAPVDGHMIHAVYLSNDTFYVIRDADTLLRLPGMHPTFEFRDYDGDSHEDILVNFPLQRIAGVQSLLLYNPDLRSYVEVKDFFCPASQPIYGTELYYSYGRTGCADLNWISQLFRIENYQVKFLGTIVGLGCENDTTGIFIYKGEWENETLVEQKDISVIDNYKSYKWGFIEHYWRNNYERFTAE